MANDRRKTPGPRFSGPVVDALTGINPNTRRAGEARGVLKPDEDGYDLEQLTRAAAWAAIARLGIQSKGTRDYLIHEIAQDMRVHAGVGEPRFLVLCPVPDPSRGYDRPSWPPPIVKRMQDGGVVALADGNGAVCIVRGLSKEDLRRHFEWSAEVGGDDLALTVFNTTGLWRRLRGRIEEHARREAGRP